MKISMLSPILLAVACGGEAPDLSGIGSKGQGTTVLDVYERQYDFVKPAHCNAFIHQRAVDEESHFVEYEARIGGQERSLVYTLLPDEARPLRASVYIVSEGSARLSFAIEIGPDEVMVKNGEQQPVLTVSRFAGPRAATGTVGSGEIDDAAGLELLGCTLPIRTELGAVPAFLLNRGTGGRDPARPEVSRGSANAPPLLTWTSPLSLLGAYTLASACLHLGNERHRGWDCPCLTDQHDRLVGPIEGWCEPDLGHSAPSDVD
jgi:hypothetical protein